MICFTVSSRSCSCCLYIASPSSAPNNIINLGIDHLVMSMYRVISYYWKRVFAMTSVFSWQNSVSFCPASFCTPRSNLPVTPSISWVPSSRTWVHCNTDLSISIYLCISYNIQKWIKSYDNLTSNNMKSTKVFCVSAVILGPLTIFR